MQSLVSGETTARHSGNPCYAEGDGGGVQLRPLRYVSPLHIIHCYQHGVYDKFEYKSTGWAKSQCANVGLNSSVTECPIEILPSGMT
jgi:hypothetical protein